MDFNKPRKAKSTNNADIDVKYDKDSDKVTLVISNVSESFVDSKSSDNKVISFNVPILNRLKLNGNLIYLVD